MALTVNMQQARSQLSRLVAKAQTGEEILIAKAGKPVARLTRIEVRAKPRRFGTVKGGCASAKILTLPSRASKRAIAEQRAGHRIW
jgi:prevent-host-death family protein